MFYKITLFFLILYLLPIHVYAARTEKDYQNPTIACLKKQRETVQIKYNSLKKLVRQQMIEFDQASMRNEALTTYQTSEKRFQQFMQQNCTWYAAVAMDGVSDNCEIEMIRARSDALRKILGH